MDKAGGGKTSLCSHLETTASFKRRHGLEACDLTVQSLTKGRIKLWKVLDIDNGIARKRVCVTEGVVFQILCQ